MDQIRRLRQFITEVWSELKKTSWPRRHEVYGTTLVVILAVVICAVYLGIVDKFLSVVMQQIYGAFM